MKGKDNSIYNNIKTYFIVFTAKIIMELQSWCHQPAYLNQFA